MSIGGRLARKGRDEERKGCVCVCACVRKGDGVRIEWEMGVIGGFEAGRGVREVEMAGSCMQRILQKEIVISESGMEGT